MTYYYTITEIVCIEDMFHDILKIYYCILRWSVTFLTCHTWTMKENNIFIKRIFIFLTGMF